MLFQLIEHHAIEIIIFLQASKYYQQKKSEIPEFILKRRKIAKSICDKRN